MTLTFALDDKGILPDRMIALLAADGGILSENQFVPDQIAGESRSAFGRGGLSCAGKLPPGPYDCRPAHRRTEAARDFVERWCCPRNRLRLHRAFAGKPGI